jgi:uncharacterized protein YraI
MMKTKRLMLKIGCFFSILLAGCAGAGGPGPRTWIDSPLNGSTLPLAPVIVRSHASSGTGTISVALYVNGTQIRSDNQADPSNQLSEASQVWQPDAPGEYALQVVAIDHEGNEGRSNTVRVRIGEEVVNPAPIEGGQAPETVETAETILPASIETDTPTLPPPPSSPSFTFTTNANCREGPGTAYEVDDSFLQGQSAQIDGRNQSEPRWWLVLRSNGGHCWVSDSTGTASGPTGNVQVVNAPPPPVVVPPPDTSEPPPPLPQTAPAAPGNLSVTNHVCASPTYSVTLGWQDLATNEQGYRVYRDNTLIATLGANATSYADIPPGSGPYTYKVEAFNNVGAASATTSDGGCIF